jgi:hypothetical protein
MQYDFIFTHEVRHTDENSSSVGVMLHKECQYIALLSVQLDAGDTQGPGCPSVSTSDNNLRRADALVR